MVHLFEDESHPDIQVRWLDRRNGDPIDFTSDWSATVQFIRDRTNTIIHEKTTGFLLGDGAGGLANVVIAITPDELSDVVGVPGVFMKLIMTQAGTGEKKVFRVLGAFLPQVRVEASAVPSP
jgi:hypothetical protein